MDRELGTKSNYTVLPIVVSIGVLIVLICVVLMVIWLNKNRGSGGKSDSGSNGSDTGGDDTDDDDNDDGLLLKKARERITRNHASSLVDPSKLTTFLNTYTILPNATTTVYAQWETDETDLRLMASAIGECIASIIADPSNDNALVAHTIMVANDFITRLDSRIESSDNENSKSVITNPPWGDNWRAFGVDVCGMLNKYLLIDEVTVPAKLAILQTKAAQIILSILSEPNVAFKKIRYGFVTLAMAQSWMLARKFESSTNIAAKSFLRTLYSNEKLRACLNLFQPSIIPDDDNTALYSNEPMILHRDGTYTSHGDQTAEDSIDTTTATVTSNDITLAYDILDVLDRSDLVTPLFALLDESPTFRVDRFKPIIWHPRIPRCPIGMWGARVDLEAPTNTNSEYGLAVVPWIKYLRYFDEDSAFAVRGLCATLAYYQATSHVNNTVQYWTQFRGVLGTQSPIKPSFPQMGFIAPTGADDLFVITTPTTITVPTTTSGLGGWSKTFLPDVGVTASAVLCSQDVGVLYQIYRMPQVFGPTMQVEELIWINAADRQATAYITITTGTDAVDVFLATSEKQSPIHNPTLVPYTVSANTTKSFATRYDFGARSIISSMDTISVQEALKIPVKTSTSSYELKWSDDGDFAILSRNTVPYIISPYRSDGGVMYDTNQISIKINERTNIFTFDHLQNQYVMSGIEKRRKISNTISPEDRDGQQEQQQQQQQHRRRRQQRQY